MADEQIDIEIDQEDPKLPPLPKGYQAIQKTPPLPKGYEPLKKKETFDTDPHSYLKLFGQKSLSESSPTQSKSQLPYQGTTETSSYPSTSTSKLTATDARVGGEERFEDAKTVNKVAAGIYNTIVGSFATTAGGISHIGQDFDTKIRESFNKQQGHPKGEGIEPFGTWRKESEEQVEQLRSPLSTKEEEAKRSEFDLKDKSLGENLKALAFTAPSTILDMLGGAVSGGSTFFLQSVNDSAKELEENPNAAKLTDNEKIAYVYVQGVAQAALEKFGVDKVLKATGLSAKAKQKIANEVVDGFLKSGTKASAEQIEKEVLKKVSSLSTRIKKVGVKGATAMFAEGLTEGGQSATKDGIKLLTNKIKGSEIFDEEDIAKNFVKNVANATAQGGAFGLGLGGAASALSNAKTSEDFQKIQADIATQLQNGTITPEVADQQSKEVAKQEKNVNHIAQVKTNLAEKDLSEDVKEYYADLSLTERLANEKAEKLTDPTLIKEQKEIAKEAAEIKEQLLAGVKPEDVVTEKQKKEIEEQEKTKVELERLKVDNQLNLEKIDAQIEETDGRESQANRIKLKELNEKKKRINEDYQKAVAKLTPKEEVVEAKETVAEVPDDLKERGEQVASSFDAESRQSNGERIFGFPEQDGEPVELTRVEDIRKYAPDQLMAYPRETDPIKQASEAAWVDIQDPNIAKLFAENPEQGLKEAAQQLNASKGEAETARKVYGDTISDIALKLYPKEKVPESKAPPPSEKVIEDKSESTVHKENIHTKFREQFTKKGVPSEQVDGAIALMEARAKSWASEEKGRNPEDWYGKIADVKAGEFETNDVKFQGEWKKALIGAYMALQPLSVKNSAVTDPVTKYEVQYITKMVEDYYSVNDEKAPKEVVDRAVRLYEMYGKPEILPDSTKKDERAYATPAENGNRAKIGNITNFDDFIAEIAHSAQFKSGAKLDYGNYTNQQLRDLLLYEQRGSVEYDAHKIIEPILAEYVLTGKKGDDLINSAKFSSLKNGWTSSNPQELERMLRSDYVSPVLEKYKIKFQGNKGALETLKDGKVVIHALESPDFSTMVHEIAHVFEKDLTTAEQKTVEKFGGSEAFARGFERYVRDGKAPTSELQKLFDKFKDWLTNIYQSLKGSPIEKKVSPEVKQIFDRLLTEKPRSSTPPSETKAAEGEKTTQQPENQPPTEPPIEEPPPTETEGSGKEKGILNRLYNAKNVPAAAKKGFEEIGLKYEPKSNEENSQVAKTIVDELGIDDAVLQAKANNFGGGVNSAVFAESLNRIKEAEDKATTPEAKLEQAYKFAEVADQYDQWARDKGRDISQIQEFYQKSPLGVVIKENQKKKEDFEQWAKAKDKSWKEFFEELKKEPEFEKVFKENVKEELKKERQEARKERISKVDKFFDDAKKNFNEGGAVYSTIIPPKVITAAIDGMKKAYHAGEKVAELVQDAIDYITEQMGKAPWDSEKFRKEWQEKLKDKTEKKPLTDEELKSKVLDRFRKKLKGLTEAQKDDVIRQAHKQLIDNGALEFDDFKKIIARVVGRGELTVEEANRMKELVKITNELEDAAKKAREERTVESFKKYKEQQVKTARAARELNEMFLNKPDIIRRITGIMQLNTLGIVSLINNPVYNIMNQSAVRFPIGLLNDVGDRVAKLIKKDFEQENNVLETQKDFWEMVGVGGKEAAQQLLTGLNRSDYIQKELYSEQIRPFKALRDLNLWRKGQKQLSKRQVIDKMLQGTVGIPAEAVARMLNIGDKPQRFAAAGAQAAAFAKTIGLKNIDKKLFMEFPREEAYRAYKAQGLSDAKAGEKADYIKDVIIKEGERSTFQQENLFNDLISAAAGKLFGGKDTGAASLAKTLAVSPYIKIPSNAFWSMYNLLNPEIAILQSIVHGTRSGIASKKGETNKSKLQLREARYWLAHAIVGMATRAVVISLVQAGLFTPSADEDDPKKEREAVGYFDKAGTMQIGEMKVSNRWLGQFGMLGNQMARQYQDMTPEQKENMDEFWNVVWGGMERAGLQEVENGILANTSSLAEFALGGGDMSRYMNNTLNLFTNIVQPGTIAQFNRASLDEVPSSKGDSFLDKLNQNFAQRSTLYRKMFDVELRKKRDIWGQTMPKEGNVLSRMFGISKANPQIFARNLYDEFLRTNNRDFLPPAVTPTLNNQKLTADQTLKLEEYVGSERKKLIEPYINDMSLLIGFNKKYSELNDEEKVTILKTIYDIGSEYGKERFLTENPQFEKPKETLQERINDAKAGAFRLKTKYEARKE